MGSASSSRRPGLPGGSSVLTSRYSNRRFRGHLSNSPSLSPHTVDSKAPGQRTSGSRATPLGLGSTAYPGFRNVGMGYKGALSSGAPGFTSHSSVAASGMIGGNANAASIPKSHGTTESGLPTGQSGGATEGVGPITNRHKDTAFLCSCGKDFENLYVFIIHMKDTGHKPKSDNCDKDIPKLVRGQDMWINSETEQTREILRCMRCHQSFRSLPELTLHMMKTNHYSDIVYNDSGRLVFVNPDEHRRGPTNSSNSTPSLSTSGKVSPGLSVAPFSSRRGWKTLNYTPTTSANGGGSLWTNGPQTSMSDHCEDGRRPYDRPEVKGLNQPTVRTAESHTNSCGTERSAEQYNALSQAPEKLSGETTPESGSASPNTKDSSHYTNIPDCGSDRGSQKSPVSLKSDSCTNNQIAGSTSGGEINVLRQIESFVENSLPTASKCLSVKTDGSASSASSSLTYAPLSALTPTSEGTHSSWGNMSIKQPSSSQSASRADRKRRYSDANSRADACHSSSPCTSPIDEAKDAKIMAKESGSSVKENRPSTEHSTDVDISVLSSTTPSPSKVTSTTSDHEIYEKQRLRAQQPKSPIENPLSSLQKLVDTTANKPVAPSTAFSEMHTSYPQHISLPGLLSSGKTVPHASRPQSRTSGSQLQGTRPSVGTATDPGSLRNTGGISFATHAGMQATTAEDSEMPALSALYAYVERSSPCQSQESASNLKESFSPPEAGEVNKPFDRFEANLPRSLNSPLNQPSIYTGGAQSVAPQISPPSEAMSITSQLQQAAFCAAVLSNLTNAQHAVNSQVPTTQGNASAIKDAPPPPFTLPDAPQFGREAASIFGGGNSQRNEMVSHWWRMLQYMLSCSGGTQFPMLPPALTDANNGPLRDAEKGSTGSVKSETRLSDGTATGRNPFVQQQQQQPSCSLPPSSVPLGLNSVYSGCTGNASSTIPSAMPSSTSSAFHSSSSTSQFMNSLANYRAQAQPPAPMGQRFGSNLMAQSLHGNPGGGGSGIGSGLVSSIITKKAKCHFCGKPFANKGQVRLHISKNKCPCLLQQSCHVAALAAAFGGDNHRAGKHSFANPGSHNNNSSSGSNSNGNNSSLGGSSVTNRFSPLPAIQKPMQSHLLPLGSTGANAEDGQGVPSALSLLKERFQNFELSLTSGQGNQQSQVHQQVPNVSMVSSTSPLTPHSITSSVAPTTGTPVPGPLGEAGLSAIASALPHNFPHLQNLIQTPSNSAANANHLAAMALLAQTLVQLTSANTTAEAVSAVSSEATDRPAPKHQPPDEPADSQPFASLEAFMPLLAASGGLDRKALFNSAQWFTNLANSPAARSSTTGKHKSSDIEERLGQSTGLASTASDLCDGQLRAGRPRSNATPNGHL